MKEKDTLAKEEETREGRGNEWSIEGKIKGGRKTSNKARKRRLGQREKGKEVFIGREE